MRSLTRRRLTTGVAAAMLGVAGIARQAAAQAPAYPMRQVTITVPFPAGSFTDTLARHLGQRLSVTFRQPFVIENRAGGGGAIAAREMARAPADGYSLFFGSNSTHAANMALMLAPGYDPVTEFRAVARLVQTPQILVVRPGLEVRDFASLLALARARPGALSYASGNSINRAAAELLMMMTETVIEHVPYRGTPQAVTDLLGGHVDLFIADGATLLEHIQAGRLRALAVTSRARMTSLPDIPTLDELGLAGYEMLGWFVVTVPRATPDPIVATLSSALLDIMRSAETRQFVERIGGEPFPAGEAETARFIVDEIAKWRRIVEAARIERQ
jgi:tripartite-type tricarboxylate transporter receptor subunit TctC